MTRLRRSIPPAVHPLRPLAGGVRGAARGGANQTSLSSVNRPVLSPTRSTGTSSLPSSDR